MEGRWRSAWRLKMKPWRVFSPVVTDSHHFGEKALRWKEGSGSELKWCGSATLLNNKSNSFTAVYGHLPSTYIQVCLKANSCNFYAAKVTLALANWGNLDKNPMVHNGTHFSNVHGVLKSPEQTFFYKLKVKQIEIKVNSMRYTWYIGMLNVHKQAHYT